MATELTEAGLEARRKYMREYKHKKQKENRERQRDSENRYWNKVGARMEAEEAAKKRQENTEMRKPDIDEIRRSLAELRVEWKECQGGRQINLIAPDRRNYVWYPETGTLMFNWQRYGGKEVIHDVYSPELAVWIVRNALKGQEKDGSYLDK